MAGADTAGTFRSARKDRTRAADCGLPYTHRSRGEQGKRKKSGAKGWTQSAKASVPGCAIFLQQVQSLLTDKLLMFGSGGQFDKRGSGELKQIAQDRGSTEYMVAAVHVQRSASDGAGAVPSKESAQRTYLIDIN